MKCCACISSVSRSVRRTTDALSRTVPPKPLSQEQIAPPCFCKKIILAGFAAETQAPMLVADKTKFSPTVWAAVLQLAHDAPAPRFHVGSVVEWRPCMRSRALELVSRCQSFVSWRQRNQKRGGTAARMRRAAQREAAARIRFNLSPPRSTKVKLNSGSYSAANAVKSR